MMTIPAAASPPLLIAVIGAGAIGSTFAHRLALAGHDVTVIARPGSARLGQLQRDGGVIDRSGVRTRMQVADHLAEQTVFDLVLVTTLDHQVDAVLPGLQRSQARCVQFMFNTFNPERLSQAVGEHRCSFGMPFVMATLGADGRLKSTVSAQRKTLHSDQRWVDLFRSAGIPSALEPKMPLWLRCHVPMCIAMESISVAAVRRGGGASWTEAVVVANGLRAGFAILQGLGHPLYPTAKSKLNARPTLLIAGMLWTVSRIGGFRDLLATGVGECRALADVVVAAATNATPPLDSAARAVTAMKPAG